MCIIVAKNQGVKMPSKEIITNCFTHNPDGAGIMLAAKGKVYGFKGLMTLDAVLAKLKQLEKRFGPLDKLPVVLHFRIGTHGANIAANTHPFPVANSYKALRKLEWTSPLGMAHNGIITATGHHPDIKKENVSDTMVFIRRIAAPFCEKVDPFKNPAFFDALQIVADSKLCFLNGRGELKVLGQFESNDGVYYSNGTWQAPRYKSNSLTSFAPYFYDWDDYDLPSKKSTKGNRTAYMPLSKDDEAYLKQELAFDYGLELLEPDTLIRGEGYELTLDGTDYAVDWADGCLYYWDSGECEWYPSDFEDVEVVFPDREGTDVHA